VGYGESTDQDVLGAGIGKSGIERKTSTRLTNRRTDGDSRNEHAGVETYSVALLTSVNGSPWRV